MSTNLPFVSVLVPSYERHDLLIASVRGLLDQDYEPLEIVVYDQSHRHPQEVHRFFHKHRHRVTHVGGAPRGLVAAYRRCMELARGEICIFIDDDVLITEAQFVGNHVKNYRDLSVGAVCGQILHENGKKRACHDRRIQNADGWRHVKFNCSKRVESFPSLAGANMSFRKNLYEQAGGFDANYLGSGFRFETDFSFAIRKLGYRIVYDSCASLVHRYGSEGGANNKHLHSTHISSHRWYQDFFFNTWYFLTKWYPLTKAVWLMGLIWREHVFNRHNIRVGLRFQLARNLTFIQGVHNVHRSRSRSIR